MVFFTRFLIPFVWKIFLRRSFGNNLDMLLGRYGLNFVIFGGHLTPFRIFLLSSRRLKSEFRNIPNIIPEISGPPEISEGFSGNFRKSKIFRRFIQIWLHRAVGFQSLSFGACLEFFLLSFALNWVPSIIPRSISSCIAKWA